MLGQHFLRAVENHFVNELKRPELLNRLGDNIVVFNRITDKSFRRSILDRKLSPLKSYLKERFGVNIHLAEETANSFSITQKEPTSFHSLVQEESISEW